MRNLNLAFCLSVLVAGAALATTPAAISAAETQKADVAHAIVYFTDDSDALDAEAEKILDGVAAAFAASGKKYISVDGHAGRLEGEGHSPDYSRGLSQRRSASVRSYLWGQGIEGNVMLSNAWGEDRADAGGERRRVEIVFTDETGY